jgi:lambda repressor-like predicted transcriptional regulator
MLGTMHREDVVAALRKRYGSVAAFERAKGLPAKSVAEVLRGRAWRTVFQAVEAALKEPLPERDQSETSDSNAGSDSSHRLNSSVA